MKKFLLLPALVVLLCGAASAQMISPGGNAGNGMEKLFGDNQTFSATMKTEVSGDKGSLTTTAKMFFNHGNSRTEMNISDVKSDSLPAGTVAQMQAMGMDKTILISSADKKNNFLVYPDLQSYTMVPTPNSAAATNEDYKIQTTKLGDETVDGHPCIKNKTDVIVAGKTNEFTVWNASDLKNFPIKIVMTKNDTDVTISFQNVSFEKPEEALFVPPPNFTRYDNFQALMREALTKRMGNAPATTPPN
jgi:outer membrane lipoprotein-sorting protein